MRALGRLALGLAAILAVALATFSAMSIAFSPTSADIELDAGKQSRRDVASVEAQRESRAYDTG